MSQRLLIFPLTSKTRDIIIVGWDRPLSQLFIMAGSQVWNEDLSSWIGEEDFLVDTYIEVDSDSISLEIRERLTQLLGTIHLILGQPSCSDDVLKTLIDNLDEDMRLERSNFIVTHAISGRFVN